MSPRSHAQPTPAHPPKAPGILLFVLVATMAIGPIFNYSLGALSSEVVRTYGITEGQYGLIITLLFIIAGGSSIVLGILSDRIPVRLQITLIFLTMVVSFLVSITAPTYAALLVAAVFAGPAAALSNPATNRIIAHSVPLRQRGAWMGWKQSGVQFGLLFSGLTVPLVGGLAGWTGVAIMCASVAGVLLVVAWFVITRLQNSPTEATTRQVLPEDATDATDSGAEPAGAPRPSDTAGPAEASAGEPQPARLPLAVWLFAVCSFLNAVGTQGLNAYASLFAVQTVGFPIQLAGLLLAAIGVAGILSRNAWGRMAGRFARPAAMIKTMSLGGIVGLACLAAVALWHIPVFLWLGVLLHAAFPLAANVVINSGVMAVAPRSKIGVASGLVAAGMNFGFAVGPVLVGFGFDNWNSYLPGWIVLAIMYAACFAVAVWLGRAQRGHGAPAVG
ncbi:MFS transporter [Brevibacterium sp. 50QC2O2]|uniref:MFS transporter n=1 Tax=Brevibacterium TaxID=1696 RepID=UPI00211C61ED|nr:MULTISPECIES: MFS transporter [unclassified Brevibacterium]MCQ9369484.1 MFS transporter [Brevibacterium sp. 91QC2O2]MCQ9386553.1 MFS transporter [Brevibacterium sp. 68QC2CO]MCQ9389303.1 MFS transporter [Brevibacterium sp. 50QC2O2]